MIIIILQSIECIYDAQEKYFSSNNIALFFKYAFLLYNDERQAANVIEHADQYQINGQPLILSFYCN